jgi:hypothetical protein
MQTVRQIEQSDGIVHLTLILAVDGHIELAVVRMGFTVLAKPNADFIRHS